MESDFPFLASAFSDGFLNGVFSIKDVRLRVNLLEKAFGRLAGTPVNSVLPPEFSAGPC